MIISSVISVAWKTSILSLDWMWGTNERENVPWIFSQLDNWTWCKQMLDWIICLFLIFSASYTSHSHKCAHTHTHLCAHITVCILYWLPRTNSFQLTFMCYKCHFGPMCDDLTAFDTSQEPPSLRLTPTYTHILADPHMEHYNEWL